MRFTSKTSLERVFDGLARQTGNSFRGDEMTKERFNDSMTKFKKKQTSKLNQKMKSRDMLPKFHRKTFFKGLQSLGLRGTLSSRENGKEFEDLICTTDLRPIKQAQDKEFHDSVTMAPAI